MEGDAVGRGGGGGMLALARRTCGRLARPIREERQFAVGVAGFLLLCEALLCAAIIYKVPCE